MPEIAPVRFVCDEATATQYPDQLEQAVEGVGGALAIAGFSMAAQRTWLEGDNPPFIDPLLDRCRLTQDGLIDARKLITLVRRSTQLGTYTFAVTARDSALPTEEDLHYILGVTYRGLLTGMVSIARLLPGATWLRGVRPNDLLTSIRQTGSHEAAHLLGVVNDGAPNEDRRPDNGHHCVNDCIMGQIYTVGGAIAVAKALGERPNEGFCADCTSQLRSA